MMKTAYWASRILAYLTCIGGVALHVYHQGDPRAATYALPLIGVGFILFFVSYAIRAWIRFAPRSTPEPSRPDALESQKPE